MSLTNVVSLTPKQRPISLRFTKRAGGTSPTVFKSISSGLDCLLRSASSDLSSSWLSLSNLSNILRSGVLLEP